MADPKKVNTVYSYVDPLDRPTEIASAAGTSSETHLTYSYQSPTWTIACQTQISKNDCCDLQTQVVYNGLGRVLEGNRVIEDNLSYSTSYTSSGLAKPAIQPGIRMKIGIIWAISPRTPMMGWDESRA